MKQVDDENLHSAEGHRCPVGIECRCGRRALLPLEALHARKGSMVRIKELRLVCNRCGSRDFKAFLFFNVRQCEAFAEGQSYADVWDLRHAGLAADDPRVIYWKNPNPYRTGADAGDSPAPPRV